MGVQAKYDWFKVRADYIEGYDLNGSRHFPTMEECGQRHNVPPKYLRYRAANEGWTAQREIYQAKVEQARQDKRTTVLASRGADFDTKVLRVTEALVAQIVAAIRAANERKDKDGRPIPPDTADLQRLTSALRSAHATGRIALGESGDGTAPPPPLSRDELRIRIIRDGAGYGPPPPPEDAKP